MRYILEQRHKKDTDNRLRDNNIIQKQLTEAQQQAEMERQSKQINQRVQVLIISFIIF